MGRVPRIDDRPHRPRAVRAAGEGIAGASPSAIVYANGLWIANSLDHTVSRFNAETFEEGVVRTVSVGDQPVAIAFGAGAL